MGKHILKPEMLPKIIELRETKSLKEIASIYGCTRQTLASFLCKNGIVKEKVEWILPELHHIEFDRDGTNLGPKLPEKYKFKESN